jgi:adenylate kinase
VGRLIVLMGPTGAGKSAQGDLLAEALGGVHLSSGKLLRQDPVIAAALKDGRLAEAADVHRVVGEAMAAVPAHVPLVLDGTPRTMVDVEWLDTNLPKYDRELESAILIELDIETSIQRLVKRGRGDDTVDAIKEKYALFENVTRPVVEHYRRLGLVLQVDGSGTIEEVHEAIMQALEKARTS